MKEFDELIKIVRILRSPKGCPWDRAQKLGNYTKYLLEESYELIDGINKRKPDVVKEELGDLFLILVVISEFFNDRKKFDVKNSLEVINSKLVSRHPHVFSNKKLKTKEDVLRYWIKTKAKKKKRKTVKDRLPASAPALFLADLFLKEYTHLGYEAPVKKGEQENSLCAKIADDIRAFGKTRDKGEFLSRIIFEIAKLASLHKADLESILRNKVYKKAQETPYRV